MNEKFYSLPIEKQEKIITPGLTGSYPCDKIRLISYKAVTKTEQREAPQRAGIGGNRRAEASSHPF